MRKAIAQIGRRSRFARLGAAVGRSAIGRGGSGLLLPAQVYSSLRPPGGFGRVAAAVGAHTHAHDALTDLLDDDHTQYLLGPRSKILDVAPTGAPYSDPKTAIEAADAGDCVRMWGGTYTLPDTITVPDNNISIVGANRDGCVLNFTTADAAHCLELGSKTGLRLWGFTINAVAGKTGYGINGAACSRLSVIDIAITGDSLSRGIYTTGATDIRIGSSRIVLGATAFAIYLVGAADSYVCRNTIALAGGGTTYAIVIDTGSDRILVQGNNAILSGVDVTQGFYVANSSYVQFLGNLLRVSDPADSASYLMRIRANAVDSPGIQVIGNNFVAAGNHGVGLYLYTTSPRTIDEIMIASNGIWSAAVGIELHDARVTDAFVHGNKVATCTTGVADAGTNTNQQDQD